MSVNLPRNSVWVVAVIVGLIVATALVAGYVDRPGTAGCTALAAKGDCGACPVKGTDDCAKEAGTCPAETGDCPEGACCADGSVSGCPAAAVMAQEADGAGCPMKATVTAGQCGAGGCPAAK